MRIVNEGVKRAQGELFIILDSDDYLADNALEIVDKWEKTIHDKRNAFAGIAGLKCYYNGQIVGTTFSGDYLDASCKDREKYNIRGDRIEIWYTDILSRYPFPIIDGEKFIAEGGTWLKICEEEHKVLRWFNEPVMYCEYQADGYSAQAWKLAVDNPGGILENVKIFVRYKDLNYTEKLKQWHKYYIVAKENNMTNCEIRRKLEICILICPR